MVIGHDADFQHELLDGVQAAGSVPEAGRARLAAEYSKPCVEGKAPPLAAVTDNL